MFQSYCAGKACHQAPQVPQTTKFRVCLKLSKNNSTPSVSRRLSNLKHQHKRYVTSNSEPQLQQNEVALPGSASLRAMQSCIANVLQEVASVRSSDVVTAPCRTKQRGRAAKTGLIVLPCSAEMTRVAHALINKDTFVESSVMLAAGVLVVGNLQGAGASAVAGMHCWPDLTRRRAEQQVALLWYLYS